MKIRTVLKPGQRGTKALIKEYGNQLVCVRYRYDYVEKKKYKTIELIISEDDWEPLPLHPDEDKAKILDVVYTRKTKQVAVRIAWDETQLQQKVKSLGGIWSAKDKLWFIDEQNVRNTFLEERIVDPASKSNYI